MLIIQNGLIHDAIHKRAWRADIAAEGGNRYAQFTLGRCYEGGIGVQQDKYEALKWYNKAAAGGFKYARVRAQKLKEEIEHIIL